jgi:hypothetical protein
MVTAPVHTALRPDGMGWLASFLHWDGPVVCGCGPFLAHHYSFIFHFLNFVFQF